MRGNYIWVPPEQLQAAEMQRQHAIQQQQAQFAQRPPVPIQRLHSSPYGHGAPTGVPSGVDRPVNGMSVDGADDREFDIEADANRTTGLLRAGAVTTAAAAGPVEDGSAGGRALDEGRGTSVIEGTDGEQSGEGQEGFKAVNQ